MSAKICGPLSTMKMAACRARSSLRLAAVIAMASFSCVANASLVNVDLTGPSGDSYSTGAAVFGNASSAWNVLNRVNSASSVALNDDTGAVSGIIVSYSRLGSGQSAITTGAYAHLGRSSISTNSVSFSGLNAGGAYDLVVFSSFDGTPTFSVGAVTRSIAITTDWSNLTEGIHYALFHAFADGTGSLSFTPQANPTGLFSESFWSGFQLRSVDVPEPGSLTLAIAGLGLMAACSRRRRRSAMAGD